MKFSYRYSVAVFAAREDQNTLTTTIHSILSDMSGENTVLDILINGNKPLADALAGSLDVISEGLDPEIELRIWFLPFADKAQSWNQYLHSIWSGSDLAYFVDGYARVQQGSLTNIAARMHDTPEALAATGVPSSGSSADSLRAEMLATGGFHGSLHAIRGTALDELRGRGFRLPIGLYRTDSLIGALIAFNLDPVLENWMPERTVVEPGATWTFNSNSVWKAKDLVRHWKRMVRQARGVLENKAVRQHMAIEKKAPEALPAIADDLIQSWLRAFPGSAAKIFLTNPLCMVAAWRSFQPKDRLLADTGQTLIATSRDRETRRNDVGLEA